MNRRDNLTVVCELESDLLVWIQHEVVADDGHLTDLIYLKEEHGDENQLADDGHQDNW